PHLVIMSTLSTFLHMLPLRWPPLITHLYPCPAAPSLLHSFPTRRSSDLAFQATGGFPAIPLMEDIALCKRLKRARAGTVAGSRRSEEHTSELQSLTNLVCRLLLEKKKNAAQRI